MSFRTSVRRLQAELGDLLERAERAVDLSEYRAYDGRPVAFFREKLAWEPWEKQRELAETLERHPLVCAVGANSVGKDAVLAMYALYWSLAKGGLALIVPPTERQNRRILFREIRDAWHRVDGGLPGELYVQSYAPGEGEPGGALAMTSTSVSKLTGFHGEKVLVILSEAQDLEPYVFEAALACATGPDDVIVQGGNPLHPDSPEPIAFPRDEELVEELLAIRWREQGGKVRIEEKSEIRARIGRSPDKADALSMLFQPGRKPAEAFEFRV